MVMEDVRAEALETVVDEVVWMVGVVYGTDAWPMDRVRERARVLIEEQADTAEIGYLARLMDAVPGSSIQAPPEEQLRMGIIEEILMGLIDYRAEIVPIRWADVFHVEFLLASGILQGRADWIWHKSDDEIDRRPGDVPIGAIYRSALHEAERQLRSERD